MDATTCRLCGAAVPEGGGPRCENCGLYLSGDLGPFGYRLAAGLAGIYLLTALLVLLTRSR